MAKEHVHLVKNADHHTCVPTFLHRKAVLKELIAPMITVLVPKKIADAVLNAANLILTVNAHAKSVVMNKMNVYV